MLCKQWSPIVKHKFATSMTKTQKSKRQLLRIKLTLYWSDPVQGFIPVCGVSLIQTVEFCFCRSHMAANEARICLENFPGHETLPKQ